MSLLESLAEELLTPEELAQWQATGGHESPIFDLDALVMLGAGELATEARSLNAAIRARLVAAVGEGGYEVTVIPADNPLAGPRRIDAATLGALEIDLKKRELRLDGRTIGLRLTARRLAPQEREANEADESVLPPPTSTIAAERRCTAWLTTLMADESRPQCPKPIYLDQARQRFGIGTRAFIRAWYAAIRETNNPIGPKPAAARNHNAVSIRQNNRDAYLGERVGRKFPRVPELSGAAFHAPRVNECQIPSRQGATFVPRKHPITPAFQPRHWPNEGCAASRPSLSRLHIIKSPMRLKT